jgi:hypothetical protein
MDKTPFTHRVRTLIVGQDHDNVRSDRRIGSDRCEMVKIEENGGEQQNPKCSDFVAQLTA